MTRWPTVALTLPLSACGFLWPYPETDDTGDAADTGSAPATFDCRDATFFGDQPAYDHAGTLVGSVASPSGEIPVAGAELTVDGEAAWAVSTEAGCFTLDLPAGSHRIEVEKGRYHTSFEVNIEAGADTDVGAVPLDTGDLRVAVIDGSYDSVELLLTHIGLPYDSFARTEDVIGSDAVLGRYDAIFANCGSETSRSNTDAFTDTQFARVRDWVEDGGTLYASDLEWELFEGVAPEALAFAAPGDVLRGEMGVFDARVLSRDVVQLLGHEHIDITFDLPAWAVIEGGGEAEVVVEATVDGQTRPLAALHRMGDGRAVFTSFHNDHQATRDMQTVLYELILAL